MSPTSDPEIFFSYLRKIKVCLIRGVAWVCWKALQSKCFLFTFMACDKNLPIFHLVWEILNLFRHSQNSDTSMVLAMVLTWLNCWNCYLSWLGSHKEILMGTISARLPSCRIFVITSNPFQILNSVFILTPKHTEIFILYLSGGCKAVQHTVFKLLVEWIKLRCCFCNILSWPAGVNTADVVDR